MVSNAYSMSSILSMENQIDKLIMAFQRRLDEEVASGRWFDLSTWINFFTLDVISDLAHGDAFGFLETGQDVHGIMAALQGDSMFFAILGAFPWLAKLLFSSPMQKLVKLPDNDGLGFIMKVCYLPLPLTPQLTTTDGKLPHPPPHYAPLHKGRPPKRLPSLKIPFRGAHIPLASVRRGNGHLRCRR